MILKILELHLKGTKTKVKLIGYKIDDMTLFWGDNTLLIQLIVNLIINAIKYKREYNYKNWKILNLNNYIQIVIFNESEYIDGIKLKKYF